MVTDVSTQSWGSRLIESIKGVLTGIVFFFGGACCLLPWNEYRAVTRAENLGAAREAVVEADANTVNPSQDGQLVHMTGSATANATLSDPQFQITQQAIRLQRRVEMYSWQERTSTRTTKQTGGSTRTTTTYTYELAWAETVQNSNNFRDPIGHLNPPMVTETQSFDADNVTVGPRQLTPALIGQISNWSDLTPPPTAPQAAMSLIPGRNATVQGNLVYVGNNPTQPMVGDYRITFRVVTSPQDVSILAAQAGTSFTDWNHDGHELEQNLDMGTQTAEQMIATQEAANAFMSWVLRFVGWLLMFMGITLVLRPLVIVADVLPFAGNLVQSGAAVAAFVVASPLALIIIAISWVFVRPLIGIPLLILALGMAGAGIYFAIQRGKKKGEEKASQPQPAMAGAAPGGGFAPGTPMGGPDQGGFGSQPGGPPGGAPPAQGGWGQPGAAPQQPQQPQQGGWGQPGAAPQQPQQGGWGQQPGAAPQQPQQGGWGQQPGQPPPGGPPGGGGGWGNQGGQGPGGQGGPPGGGGWGS